MYKNRIKYGLLVVLLLFLCLFYYNFPFLILLLTVLILAPISIYVAKKTFNMIDICIDIDKKIIGKSTVTAVKIKAVNNSFTPIINMNINVKIYNEFYDEAEEYYINMPVKIKGTSEVSMDISSKFCGNICAQATKLCMFDLIGLKEYEKDIDKKASVMILPNMVELSINTDDIINGDGDINQGIIVGEDTSEILDIRKYIAGDRLQRIHWKLSAKSDEMMVKEYPLTYDNDIILLMELNKKNKEKLDAVIDSTITLAYSLLEDSRQFCVCWYNIKQKEIMKVKIITQEDIYQALNEIYATELYDNDDEALSKFLENNDKTYSNAIHIYSKEKANKMHSAKNKVVIECI